MALEPKIELADMGYVPGATRIVDDCYAYSEADQIGEGTYGKVCGCKCPLGAHLCV